MANSNDNSESSALLQYLKDNEPAFKLVNEMLAGDIIGITPELDFSNQMGFGYPMLEGKLGIKGQDLISLLDTLTGYQVLHKEFFDRLLHCPQCQAVNLRPTIHCPKCGSGNIARGRILEHRLCGYVSLEEEFMQGGLLICPKCNIELQTIGRDYQSRGLMRRCYDCSELFNTPSVKWQCLKCSSRTSEDLTSEVTIYSYSFNEEKRNWLDFELRPKVSLVEFLNRHGYQVTENAIVSGRSGASHQIDILATRDDGIITNRIAIGVEVDGDQLPIRDIFTFDDKAYDSGIHEKVMITIPGLSQEAETFARRQRIRLLTIADLEQLTAVIKPEEESPAAAEPFHYESAEQLIRYLRARGYEVTENATLNGRSGADHTVDILAGRDDGIIKPQIAIGIEIGESPVTLARLFEFDSKTYDAGIQNKVFIAIPGLSQEAKQFAEHQRIKVFEVTASQ